MVKAIWPTEDGHYEDCGACDICAHPEWGADCFARFVPKAPQAKKFAAFFAEAMEHTNIDSWDN